MENKNDSETKNPCIGFTFYYVKKLMRVLIVLSTLATVIITTAAMIMIITSTITMIIK